MPRNQKAIGAYHHGDLRRALLDEALRCVEREGVGALSLRELAVRLGVSASAPYHHFPDRGALLGELAVQGFRGLEAAMNRELQAVGPSPTDRLGALGLAYVRYALSNPGYFAIMFHPEVAHEPTSVAPKGGGTLELLQQCVSACLAEAGRPTDDPLPGIVAMWGAAHGIAKLYLEGPLGKMLSRDQFEVVMKQSNAILQGALSKV